MLKHGGELVSTGYKKYDVQGCVSVAQ